MVGITKISLPPKKVILNGRLLLKMMNKYYNQLRQKVRTYIFINGYLKPSSNPLGKVPKNSGSFRDKLFQLRSFSQQGEDLTLDRILHRKLGIDLTSYKGFYVDAGAYHPISHSTTYLLYKRGWQGVCIDISKKSCDLIKNVRPNDHVFNVATSDIDGELFFQDNNLISLTHETTDIETAGSTRINANSITTILKTAGINRQIDYLNIDTEGAELKTLMGIDYQNLNPKVISVEIHAQDIEAALKTDVALFLKDRGYSCVACNVITYFFIIPAR